MVLPWSPNLPGGVSVVVRSLIGQWRKEGLFPMVMVSDWKALRPVIDDEGILNFRFTLLGSLSWLGLVKATLTAPVILWRTWRLLCAHKISAVNFHYPSLDAFGVAMLKRSGLFRGRLVLSFHGTDARAPASLLEDRLWRWLLGTADEVTACSGSLACEVAVVFGIPLARVTAVYNGVDTDLFVPSVAARLAPLQAPCRLYIVSVGSYIPRKGHQVLLDSFARIAPMFSHMDLVIAGMEGPEYALLLARAKEHGLLQRVRLLVNLKPPEVAEVVAGATLSVQASLAEPFGMAVIEAGACGVPVAVSAVGGHLELVHARETGYLFPAGDVAGCAAVLTEALTNRKAARQMAQNFREFILSRYTWAACAGAYLRLLEG